MTPSYQTWQVRGYMRPVIEWTQDGEPFPRGDQEPVVVVFDPRGWEWEVTCQEGRLTSITVRGEISPAALRTVPLGYLREVATTYVDHVERSVDDKMPLAVALAEAETDRPQLPGDPPSLEEFAETWHATRPVALRNGRRITRRNALADRWGRSPYTIDDWTRRARDAGLIASATTGRPRKRSQTPGGKGRMGKPKK